MAIPVSQIGVLVLAGIVFVLSAWGMYSPESLIRMVTRAMDQRYGMYVAVIVRLVLGVSLIVVAPESRFPLAFLVLGWFTIVAAVGLVAIGQQRVRGIIAWTGRFSASIFRLWLLVGMAFAGFLIYGVL